MVGEGEWNSVFFSSSSEDFLVVSKPISWAPCLPIIQGCRRGIAPPHSHINTQHPTIFLDSF